MSVSTPTAGLGFVAEASRFSDVRRELLSDLVLKVCVSLFRAAEGLS